MVKPLPTWYGGHLALVRIPSSKDRHIGPTQHSHGTPSRLIRNTWDSTRLWCHLSDGQRGDGNAPFFRHELRGGFVEGLAQWNVGDDIDLRFLRHLERCVARGVRNGGFALLSRFSSQGVQDPESGLRCPPPPRHSRRPRRFSPARPARLALCCRRDGFWEAGPSGCACSRSK